MLRLSPRCVMCWVLKIKDHVSDSFRTVSLPQAEHGGVHSTVLLNLAASQLYAVASICTILSNKKGIRFICINIFNGSVAEEVTAQYKNASILNTATAAYQSPFGGHQAFAVKDLQRQIQNIDSTLHHRDSVELIELEDTVTLTRTLSKFSVKRMYHRMCRKYQIK